MTTANTSEPQWQGGMPHLLELLQAVSDRAASLASVNSPRTVRVGVGEVVVELTWPAEDGPAEPPVVPARAGTPRT